jgi:hypothetical protein
MKCLDIASSQQRLVYFLLVLLCLLHAVGYHSEIIVHAISELSPTPHCLSQLAPCYLAPSR